MEKVLEDDNLLEEILLSLPAEIVYGCILVSKRWCNLISSLPFRRRHGACHLHLPASSSKILMLDHWNGSATNLLNVRNGVTVIKASDIESDKFLSSIRPFYEKLLQKVDESMEIAFRILDVYYGLFLFSFRIRDRGDLFYLGTREDHYLVCNPLTKEYQELHISSKYKSSHPFTLTQVAFATSLKPYSGCYQVIVVSPSEAPHKYYAEYIVGVYASETGTWKDFGHMRDRSLYDSESIVWNNCLLVVPRGRWTSEWVHVLDLERLRRSYSLPLLPNFDGNSNYWIDYMGESGGFLYVIVEDPEREENQYMLWETKGFGGSWRKKFQFKTEKDATILYVHREGEHVWLLLWLKSAGKIYYCLNGNTESLQEAGDVARRYWDGNIRSYTPTLFPLGG